jgi:hypothetical protein
MKGSQQGTSMYFNENPFVGPGSRLLSAKTPTLKGTVVPGRVKINVCVYLSRVMTFTNSGRATFSLSMTNWDVSASQ